MSHFFERAYSTTCHQIGFKLHSLSITNDFLHASGQRRSGFPISESLSLNPPNCISQRKNDDFSNSTYRLMIAAGTLPAFTAVAKSGVFASHSQPCEREDVASSFHASAVNGRYIAIYNLALADRAFFAIGILMQPLVKVGPIKQVPTRRHHGLRRHLQTDSAFKIRICFLFRRFSILNPVLLIALFLAVRTRPFSP